MISKSLIFLLGFITLLVWGLIIYRIINGINEANNNKPELRNQKPDEGSSYDYSQTPDTAHLLLNYPDPFRINLYADSSRKKKDHTKIHRTG
jgi:hypothetical protein